MPSSTSPEVLSRHSLQHHFATMVQQRESSTLGMWLFLVTEIMFFGGLFTAYLIYRLLHPGAFEFGSEHMEFWLGTINTVILLCSSLTVALAVNAIQLGKRKLVVILLLFTVLMGLGFLGIKGVEYWNHWVEGSFPGHWWHMDVSGLHGDDVNAAQLFFFIYFVMTGLHALHVLIGIILLSVIAFFTWRGHYDTDYNNPVHISGLYWHFVDLIWIFLYPLLYLIAHKHG